MKPLPIPKTALDFTMLTSQNGSGKTLAEQDPTFQMLLENALNPGLPTGAESAERPNKAPEKKAAQLEEPANSAEPKADGQHVTLQAHAEPTDSAQETQAAEVTPTASAPVVSVQPDVQLPAIPIAEADVPVPAQGTPKADAPSIVTELPTGDIVSAEAVLPQQDEVVFAPELLEVARPPQADTVQAQESFDQLVAKSAEALAAKEPVAAETALPAATIEAPASSAAAQAVISETQEEMLPVASGKLSADMQPVKASRGTSDEKELDESLLSTLDIPAAKAEKAAPAVPLEKAEATTPAAQVEAQVIEHLEQGKMEFRMQLNPESLGKIDVKMVLEGGKLTVELIAANARTAELLSRQAQGLAASLRVNSAQLQSVQVVTETQNENSHMEQSLNMMMGGSYQGEGQGADEAGHSTASHAGVTAAAEQADLQPGQAEASQQPKQMLNTTV